MTDNLPLILGGILASSVLTAIVVGIFNRPKSKAETEQIATNVYRGLNSDLLTQLKDSKIEITSLHQEVKSLTERLIHMEEKDEAKEEEIRQKTIRIGELERRVDDLETELRKYKSLDESIDIVKDTLHTKIDEAAAEVKSNIKQ